MSLSFSMKSLGVTQGKKAGQLGCDRPHRRKAHSGRLLWTVCGEQRGVAGGGAAHCTSRTLSAISSAIVTRLAILKKGSP